MTLLHGFDISAYQSTTSPTADFLFVKATEGKSYTSSRFAAQWASAKSKARHRGAYHFARPEESSAASQAARFLALAKPVPGESVWLDLEASDLNQAQTNAWAKAWGDYVRAHAPGVTSGVYTGSGYASNNTGKGLSAHFSLWWYPQYPSAYQTLPPGPTTDQHRAANRSSVIPDRYHLARATTKWPAAVSPWLPPGVAATGWSKPHIWQFTDNWSGLDASVTALTLDQLAGGTQPKPTPPPAPKPKAWPGRYLKLASPLMHGSDVTWVQQHLNTHGAKLTVDSQYGPKTRDAVKAFQRAKKLEADGIVGAKTWGALA